MIEFLPYTHLLFTCISEGTGALIFLECFQGVVDGIASLYQWLTQFTQSIQELLPYNILNRLIISLIEVFFLSLVILFPVTLIIKIYKAARQRRRDRLVYRYGYLIRSYLEGVNREQIVEELRKGGSNFAKNILIELILRLDRERDADRRSLRKLYLDLKLDRISAAKIKNRKWNKRIKGIQELSQLKIKKENAHIMDLLSSSNDILRVEAQLGLIKLLPFVPFAFLESIDRPFTVWEQMNVYQLIREREVEIPEFHLWLEHWNDSVVMFSLDMIRILRQSAAVPKVLELLNHDNERVKGKVIRTLVDLESEDAATYLKAQYHLMEEENQVNIIRSIEKLASVAEIEFLEQQLEEKSFPIRMACCEALALIEPEGRDRLLKLLSHCDEELQRIIKHVLDPTI